MKVRIKRLTNNAVIPAKAHGTDAAYDLVATSRVFDELGNVVYGTGLAFEIPEGYMGLVFPRSSICKKDLALSNAVGVIDSGYRGEVMAKFKPTLVVVCDDAIGKDKNDYCGRATDVWDGQFVTFHGRHPKSPDVPKGAQPFQPRFYEVGERIGQLVVVQSPEIEFEEVDELSDSERGEGGYGSTGR